jgi:hypothetical protein
MIAVSTLVFVPGKGVGRVWGNWSKDRVWIEIEKTGEHVERREAELLAHVEPPEDEGVAFG